MSVITDDVLEMSSVRNVRNGARLCSNLGIVPSAQETGLELRLRPLPMS